MELPEARRGHVAVKFRSKILVWGGSGDSGLLDPKNIWLLDIEQQRWTLRKSRGETPPALSGSCFAVIADVLYCFAGFSWAGGTNSVYALDLFSLEWQKPAIMSRKPSRRDKLGCWVRRNKIVFFGGYGLIPGKENISSGTFVYDESSISSRGWNNDLLSYDTASCTWDSLPHSDVTPCPRAAHACVNLDNNIGYLFGGRFMTERLNDFYSISLETFLWTKIIPLEPVPHGRTWHSICAVDQNHFFMFGGLNTEGQTMRDAWIFKIKETRWEELVHESKEQRFWHTACLGNYPGQVVVFGGCKSYSDMDLIDGLRVFEITPPPLKTLVMRVIAKFEEQICGSLEELPRSLRNELSYMLCDR